MLERIRKKLREQNKTISGLEKELGFSNGTIRLWDKSSPTVKRVEAVAENLGVSLEWLITGKEAADLSPEETDLINKYRSTNKTGKKMILDHAAIVQKQLPEDPLSSVTSASWNEETGTDN